MKANCVLYHSLMKRVRMQRGPSSHGTRVAGRFVLADFIRFRTDFEQGQLVRVFNDMDFVVAAGIPDIVPVDGRRK